MARSIVDFLDPLVISTMMRFCVSALALSGAALFACDPRPTTSVIVRFDTDVVRDRVERVDVVFSWLDSGEEIARRSITQPLAGASIFPGTLVFAPTSARAGRVVRVDARLRLLDDPAPFVIARSQFAMPSSATRVHDVFFAEPCGTSGTSAFCTARESCVVVAETPRCSPVETLESLPLYDPNTARDASAPSMDARVEDSAVQIDGSIIESSVDVSITSNATPTWWPWHGARVSSGRLRFRWDRTLSPAGGVVVVCPGYTCADPMSATRVNNLSGTALVPALVAGLYNWHVESAGGTRLSPDRVFAVRALARPADEDAVALGTTLWIDARDGDSDWAIGAPGTAPGGVVTLATSMRGRFTLQAPMGAVGFGSALANAGEIRGDGRIAMAVATDADPARTSTVSIFESDGTSLRTPATAVLNGAAGERFGAAIAGGGDLDGDGFADLVIAAPGARGAQGEVRVQYGARASSALPSLVSESFEGANALGSRVVSGCDFDGDGFADYAASSDGTRAFVVVRFGGPRDRAPVFVRVDPDAMLSTSALGRSMACGGDASGDGRADLVLGDPAATIGAGRLSYAIVVSFSSDRVATRVLRQPITEIPGFAAAVAIVRDINSDRRDDLVVTATNRFVTVRGATISDYALSISAPTAISAGLSESSTPFAPALLVGGGSEAIVFRMALVSESFAGLMDTGAAGSRYGAAVLQ